MNLRQLKTDDLFQFCNHADRPNSTVWEYRGNGWYVPLVYGRPYSGGPHHLPADAATTVRRLTGRAARLARRYVETLRAAADGARLGSTSPTQEN